MTHSTSVEPAIRPGHPLRRLAVLLPLALLAACQPQADAQSQGQSTSPAERSAESAAGATDGEVLATVNGRPITQAAFAHYLEQKRASGAQPTDPASALNEMINIELLSARAVAEGIDQRESVQLELERQRKGLLASLALQERLDAVQISDEELESAYREEYVEADNTEYHASHILVKNEDEARALIARLDTGADFAELARESSVGPSASRGGDLGWFAASDVVPEFAQAVIALEDDAYSEGPVETQFGWHVIKRIETRATEPPPLAEVEDQLRRALTTRSVANYLQNLRESATIEVQEPTQ
jgi:peptidyl-prolyl cis-trans isomerase C